MENNASFKEFFFWKSKKLFIVLNKTVAWFKESLRSVCTNIRCLPKEVYIYIVGTTLEPVCI